MKQLYTALIVVAIMTPASSSDVTAGKRSIGSILDSESEVEKCVPFKDPNIPGAARRCSDGSVAYYQPDDKNMPNNATCGPTAVAALLHMVCGIHAPPSTYGAHLNVMPGDGTTEGQLEDVLNKVTRRSEGNHCRRYHWDDDDQDPGNFWEHGTNPKRGSLEWRIRPYSAQPGRFNPSIVGLKVPGGVGGHWTVVTGITKTHVIHVSWGRLYRTPVKVFRRLQAADRDIIFLASAVT